MGAGLTLYDLLGAARDGGRAQHLGAGAVAELIPVIKRDRLRGGVTYSDGVEDDARFSITVALTAVERGATAVTRARVSGLLTDAAGKVSGVKVRDLLGDGELEARASRVIDATGVWLGDPEARLGGSTMKLVPSRGSHLVFERERLPLKTGMTLRVPGRVVFVIPYPGVWLVGTTDVADDGPPDRPQPTLDEVDEILAQRQRRARRRPHARGCRRCLCRPAAAGGCARRRHRTGQSRAHHPPRGQRPGARLGRQVHDLPADGARRGRLRARWRGPDASQRDG